jgi:hypothetical protein
MSFTFGNTSVRIGNVEHFGHFGALAAQRDAERMEFLKQWHSPRALTIDWQAAGIDPANLPLDLSDCEITCEFTGVDSHIVFLTEYHSADAMEKDATFLKVAESVGALVRRGLRCAVTMDGPTGHPFRSALIKAIKARRG